MTVPAVPERNQGGMVPGPVETGVLVLPTTGEIIDLADTALVATTLNDIRSIEARLRDVKQILTDAIVRESQRQGSKTLHLGTVEAEVRGGTEVQWDIDALAEGLYEAGMSTERASEIVIETIEYKVNAREAKRAAGANPEYAKVIEAAQSVVEKKPYIVVRRA